MGVNWFKIFSFLGLFLLLTAVGKGGASAEEPIVSRIGFSSPEELTHLVEMGLDIDAVHKDYLIAYLSPQEFDLVKSKGFEIMRIPNYAKLMADSLWEATKDSRNPMGAYHTYEELTAELDSIAIEHPAICWLESIGQSVQGRELWFMKISDNVSQEEDEPEFKYISTMHGDEPVGTELLMYLINYLVDNYGTDSLVTYLVDNTEIWIMPLMNPDGNALHQRYNANGEDLNRNFPDPITDSTNTPEGREPETQAVMNFCFGQSSVSSANFHTGALVVNYPWDCQYLLTPDDDLFIEISLVYSRLNPPMYNSSVFDSGITNGAQWYIIHGGMQDWNYNWLACNEVTIELYDTKWPDPSVLPGLWEDNREAMLAYMDQCHRGIRGLVTDASTGQPLAATVSLLEIGKDVYTDPDVGDYHRMLLPGTYTVQFSAEGYWPQTFSDVEVVADSATRLDVQLHQLLEGNISGTVRDSVSCQPLYASVEVLGPGVSPVYTDSLTGYYSINVYQGTYTMRVSSNGYRTLARDSVVVTDSVTQDFQLEPLPVHYYTQSNPLPIPDNDGWVESHLNVPDSIGIEDMNVFVNITHSYIGDLVVKLVSPQGTEVTLHNRSGGSDDDIVGWYDTDIPPDGPGEMGDFIGENVQGQWAMWLQDWAAGNVGTLNWWKLQIYGTGSVQSDSIAPATITDLSVSRIDDTSATLVWTAPGDDGGLGIASLYDLRYSLIPVGADTVSWWNTAETVSGEPWPSPAGMPDSCNIQNLFPDTTYYFIIKTADEVPNWSGFSNVAMDSTTNEGISDLTYFSGLPESFELLQNYPNPFNPITEIRYALPADCQVKLEVYNVLGEKAATLVDEQQTAGYRSVSWNASNHASGVYFYQLIAGRFSSVGKMVLLR